MRLSAVMAIVFAFPLPSATLAAQDTLRVLYHTTGDTVAPSSIVTVMFDRPVAGALDSTVRAARVFHIEPNVAGSVAWRDPVTIRFIPAAVLTPGTRYNVTIDDAIRAADGSMLAAPYRFSFRVAGARLLARSFDRAYFGGDTLPPDGHIKLLYSAPVDVERLQRATRIELSGCVAADTIPLRAIRQRPIGPGDPDSFRWTGAYPADSIANSLRRVVDLEPARTLPLECRGKIVIPTTADDSAFGRVERFEVSTAPVFRIRALDCRTEEPHSSNACNKKILTLWLSSPIRRQDLLRYIRLDEQPVTYDGRAEVAKQWSIPVRLVPRSRYAVRLDTALRDVYGRQLEGPGEIAVVTADFAPQVAFATGIITAPSSGPRNFPLKSVNVQAVRVIAYRIADSAPIETLRQAPGMLDLLLERRTLHPETTTVTVPGSLNRDTTVQVPIPPMALTADRPLVGVRVEVAQRLTGAYSPDSSSQRHELVLVWPDRPGLWWRPVMLLQVTDLAVTAKLVGAASGGAAVTDLATGRPRPNVTVRQIDRYGRAVGRGLTNAEGIAALERIAPDSILPARTPTTPTPDYSHYSLLVAETDRDHVAMPLERWDFEYNDQNPLRLAALGVRHDTRPLVAAAIFGERDIFRPGEMVHLKAVVRQGMLGALHLPARGDSVRIVVRKQPEWWLSDDNTTLRDTVLRLSEFGTVVDSVRPRPGSTLGGYVAELSVAVRGQWTRLASTEFRLAEYRAPQFLVDLLADSVTRYAQDTVNALVHGRYLFGAPMRGGVVKWSAVWDPADARELRIPHSEGWHIGGWSGWAGVAGDTAGDRFAGVDTLDADGRAHIRIPVTTLPKAPGELEIDVAVTDLVGQVITTSATAIASPGSVYVLARDTAKEPWRIGAPASIDVRAVDRFGMPVLDAVVRAVVLRHYSAAGDPTKGTLPRWVTDTIRVEELRPVGDTISFAFTPHETGDYLIDLSTIDAAGASSHTIVEHSVQDRVIASKPPVSYRLALKADTTKLTVGATARVHFESPFDDADAWITLEREGIIAQRRQHASRGDNVVSLPITERLAPNVFVSVQLLARADSMSMPDTALDRLRVGYVELSVAPDRQRLSVAVAMDRVAYAPRDTVAVRLRVRDSGSRGIRADVALWAVDQGVLALTDFRTPNVLGGLYSPRGVGAPLWSTLPTILTSNPDLVSTFERPRQLGFAMSAMNSAVAISSGLNAAALRSRFNSTAFYLGSIVTDRSGNAVARVTVPDNLTTFRVMAVAVGAGDRYGSGDTTMLVTRPLVARAALPRFVRPSDSLVAGVVVTPRDGRPRAATADASAAGLAIQSPARMSVSLSASASAEARFVVTTPGRNDVGEGDSVSIRLGATDGVTADGTETWLPVRPDFHRRTHAVLGAVRDSQDVALVLPPDVDPRRSRMRLRIGTSRISTMLAGYRWLIAYRFDCTEQLTSVGRGIVAVWRATRRERQDVLGGDPHAKLQEIADEISRRQDPDGSIQYWPGWHWSSPWLTAYAGLFLLDARDLGVTVRAGVIAKASTYLHGVLLTPFDTGGMNRYQQRARRLALGDRIAATEYLRRAGEPDTATERALLRVARVMTWEDRLRFAEVIASRSDMRADAESIVDSAWRAVTVAGHRVDLPDSAHAVRAFPSRIAPAARLLSASLVLRPTQPLLAALTETVLQTGRAESIFALNTQDYASVLMALANMEETKRSERVVTARAGQSRFVVHPPAAGVDTTISAPLDGMLETAANGARVLRLHVDATAGDRPVYYALEVDEVPLAPPVKPDVKGIVVERWYERFDNGAPVTRVNEGDLVRVRLRVTVPADREFVAVEDPLPAGLEPVDPSLRTSATLEPFTTPGSAQAEREGNRGRDGPIWQAFLYGSWDGGHWSPWEHKELHDDRVTYFARMLWTGSYTASYIARATTAGSFVAPPAYAEEMYNPALQGRSSGGRFNVDRRR